MFSIDTHKHPDHMRWLIRQLMHTYWGWWLDEERIRLGVENSLCFWMFVYEGELAVPIGFARVVTDKSMFSSIVDFFIVKDHQRQGLGTELLRTVVKHPDVCNTICIASTRDAQSFYRKCGFGLTVDPAMKRDPI